MKRLVVMSLAVSGVAAGVCTATDAHAIELGTPATEHPFRSAQNFALEIRLSPYRPQVDEETSLGGSRPLAGTFGTKGRFFIGVELDWQTIRIPHFGTIGPGVGIGYVSMSTTVDTVSGRTSADETSLSIYPIWAVGVARADVLWREFGIPFVPYGKAGLAVAPWRASNSTGTSNEGGVNGKGTSWGTDFALGMSFALDALDPGASRNMDNSTGINNTYVYFEAYWLQLDGIAQKNALHVGTNTWSMGLAFEF